MFNIMYGNELRYGSFARGSRIARIAHTHRPTGLTLCVEQRQGMLGAGLAEDLAAAATMMLPARQIELPGAGRAVSGDGIGRPYAR